MTAQSHKPIWVANGTPPRSANVFGIWPTIQATKIASNSDMIHYWSILYSASPTRRFFRLLKLPRQRWSFPDFETSNSHRHRRHLRSSCSRSKAWGATSTFSRSIFWDTSWNMMKLYETFKINVFNIFSADFLQFFWSFFPHWWRKYGEPLLQSIFSIWEWRRCAEHWFAAGGTCPYAPGDRGDWGFSGVKANCWRLAPVRWNCQAQII